MSPSVHFISNSITDCTCFLTPGICAKTVPKSLSAARVKFLSLRCASNKQHSIVCNSTSGPNRRNPDFSRQNKNGFSRTWNKPNGDKGDNEESESVLSSRNGPLFSFSGSKKSPATAAPGPREKEIVELFRKVQAQLRERASVKEDKKVEETQVKSKDSDHVDSLLRLLRKHSVQQKKEVITANEEDFILEEDEEEDQQILQPQQPEKQENEEMQNRTRPRSSFRKKSPVPQIKYHQPEDIEKESGFKEEVDEIPDVESDQEIEGDSLFSEGNVYNEISELEVSEMYENEEEYDTGEEMHAMKLTELRALAKSRGLKGYSKLKKIELIEMLND